MGPLNRSKRRGPNGGTERRFFDPVHPPFERIVCEEREAPLLPLFPPVKIFSFRFRTGQSQLLKKSISPRFEERSPLGRIGMLGGKAGDPLVKSLVQTRSPILQPLRPVSDRWSMNRCDAEKGTRQAKVDAAVMNGFRGSCRELGSESLP